jgi:TorA maturation chaperone TorD
MGGQGTQRHPDFAALSRLAGQLIRRVPVDDELEPIVAQLSHDRFRCIFAFNTKG